MTIEVRRADEGFFFQEQKKKKGWPSQGKYSCEQKGDADKRTEAFLDFLYSQDQRTVLGLRFQPLAKDKLEVRHSLQENHLSVLTL